MKTYQDQAEIDQTYISHTFKNVSFNDDICSLCQKPHKCLDCPSLRSIIELEITITAQNVEQTGKQERNYDTYYDNKKETFTTT